ncbi:MAG: HI0074 family nucleotidyltransferase substrate-binding subunit [Eubacteriales bacterium]|nr:HI0074 family nucleotidyltransferase substrate-binding subunit [Eubacteriales bacterium]
MDIKSKNRFNTFKKSLAGLALAKTRDPEDEFVLSGTVQKFCLTFDIAWKVMKDLTVKYFGILDFATGSPRECLRMAYSVKLISDDRWMQMARMRKDLTHDYEGSLAKESFHIIIDEYLDLFEEFAATAAPYMSEEEIK